MAGVELRLVDDAGTVLPWDGTAVGEIQVRGPWVTGAYHLAGRGDDPRSSGRLAAHRRRRDRAAQRLVQITDRSKDVIKSGGEWISSVELEEPAHGPPRRARGRGRRRARPALGRAPAGLRRPGRRAAATRTSCATPRRAHRPWQLPERWTVIDEVPKTSVGKFDKKVLRKQYADGQLSVEEI
jgi:fatty-acyl-CoA synthase